MIIIAIDHINSLLTEHLKFEDTPTKYDLNEYLCKS